MSEGRSLRDRVRARSEQREREQKGEAGYLALPTGVELLEYKEGKMDLDIVTYLVSISSHPMALRGETWYERTFGIHRGIGAENKTYICPQKTSKRKCPICEARAALIKDGYDKNKELIDKIKAKLRQIFNIDYNGKTYILECSYHALGKFIEKEINTGEEDWANFANIKGGYTLKVRWDKTDIKDYLEAGRIDFVKRGDYDESILKEMVDLDSILVELSYDELNKIFLEIEDESPSNTSAGTSGSDAGTARRTRQQASTQTEATQTVPQQEASQPPPGTQTRTRQTTAGTEQPSATGTTRQRTQQAPPPPPPSTETGNTGANICPAKGKWAVDCDKLDHCPACTVWEGCRDDADKLATRRTRN